MEEGRKEFARGVAKLCERERQRIREKGGEKEVTKVIGEGFEKKERKENKTK
jgi:hypothetical protein